ncbi:MAG: helix-turn-helix domain-containing protein [Planctomycetaceae bacterium]
MQNRLAFSFRELADAIGVCPRSIANWVARGELRAIKVGSRTVVTVAEAERWLATRPARGSRTRAAVADNASPAPTSPSDRSSAERQSHRAAGVVAD